MAKIVLGNCPKNFKRTVKFKLIDGTDSSIDAVYKYRTKTEFGKFIDAKMEEKGQELAEGEKFSLTKLMENTRDSNADYLIDALDGWNLDDELSRENLQRLADEFPGAATALMESYRIAIAEGRLGN